MRAFAVVPAAGLSQRMGGPKLLLPWGDHTVIEQVLATWRVSHVEATIVVVGPGGAELADRCRRAAAQVVVAPQQPPDMKSSVRLGLEHVATQFEPTDGDAWLLAPADMPLLDSTTIDSVISAWKQAATAQRETVYIATHGGRRGHPALFPWRMSSQVFDLSGDEGIDALVRRSAVSEVPVSETGAVADLDTPEDYERLRRS